MRNRLKKPAMLIALVMGAFLIMGVVAESVSAMPMFARKYGTSCNTCHIAIPRLNAFGRAYKRNSFFWPGGGAEGDDAASKIKKVELGNAHFGKRGTISSSVPLGFFAQYRVGFLPDANTSAPASDRQAKFDFGLDAFDIFTGGTLGDSFSYLVIMAISGTAIHAEAAQFEIHGLAGNFVNVRAGLMPGGPALLDTGYHGPTLASQITPKGRQTGFNNERNAGIEFYGQGKNWAYAVGIGNGSNGTASNLGTGSAGSPGKTVWASVDIQIGGMALDGTGGAKHAQSWRDDHVRVRPYVMYSSDDAGYKKSAIGAELELWYNIVEFRVGAQSVKYEIVTGGYDENAFIIDANLDLILMNGTIIPGVSFFTDLNTDAKGRTSLITSEKTSAGKKPMYLNIHMITQLRANVTLAAQAQFKLHSVAADEGTLKSRTFDKFILALSWGW